MSLEGEGAVEEGRVQRPEEERRGEEVGQEGGRCEGGGDSEEAERRPDLASHPSTTRTYTLDPPRTASTKP